MFDSHLNVSSVQAYEMPLLGSSLSSFPSFVCCFVVTGELYHFYKRSQDFFGTFLKFFSLIHIPRTSSCLNRKCLHNTTKRKNTINLNKSHARAIVGKYKN